MNTPSRPSTTMRKIAVTMLKPRCTKFLRFVESRIMNHQSRSSRHVAHVHLLEHAHGFAAARYLERERHHARALGAPARRIGEAAGGDLGRQQRVAAAGGRR